MPLDDIHAIELVEVRNEITTNIILILMVEFHILGVHLEALPLTYTLSNISHPLSQPKAIVTAGVLVVKVFRKFQVRPTAEVRSVAVDVTVIARELRSNGFQYHAAPILLR